MALLGLRHLQNGDVQWIRMFRTPKATAEGPTSIQWEDVGMDRLIDAPRLAMVT